MEEEREPTLLDLTRFGLANPASTFPFHNPKIPNTKDLYRAFDTKLIRAKKFMLTDDLVHVVAAFSLSPANILSRVLSKCRAPYDTVWIELNERARIEYLEKQGYLYYTLNSAEKLGFLIERVVEREKQTQTLYRATIVSLIGNQDKAHPEFHNKISIWPMGYLYDLEHSNFEQWMTEKDRFATEFVKLGEQYYRFEEDEYMGLSGRYCQMNKELQMAAELRDLEAHCRYCMVLPIGPQFLPYAKDRIERRDKDIWGFAIGTTGDWRLLISVLAIINSYEVTYQSIARATAKKFIKGRSMPYLEHHTLKLVVPKKKIIRRFLDADYSGLGLPRKRHDVMGHWAYSHIYGKEDCEHHWVLPPPKDDADESHVYHCIKCDKRRWWRKPHERGDARLGWVDKHYTVEHDPNEEVPTS